MHRAWTDIACSQCSSVDVPTLIHPHPPSPLGRTIRYSEILQFRAVIYLCISVRLSFSKSLWTWVKSNIIIIELHTVLSDLTFPSSRSLFHGEVDLNSWGLCPLGTKYTNLKKNSQTITMFLKYLFSYKGHLVHPFFFAISLRPFLLHHSTFCFSFISHSHPSHHPHPTIARRA